MVGFAAGLTAACGDTILDPSGDTSVAEDVVVDASMEQDGGSRDAVDAGSSSDADQADAQISDVGLADAGAQDAEDSDAEPRDAEPRDAEPADADAQDAQFIPDATSPDAQPNDGGDRVELNSVFSFTSNIDNVARFDRTAGLNNNQKIDRLLDIYQARYGTSGRLKPFMTREDILTVFNRGQTFNPPYFYQAWASHPFSSNMTLMAHTMNGNANGLPGRAAGSDAVIAAMSISEMEQTHDVWLKNVRWMTKEKAQRLPQLKIMLANNEQDNLGIGSGIPGVGAAHSFMRDLMPTQPGSQAGYTAEQKTIMRKRQIVAMKHQWEQLHGVNQPTDMQAAPANVAFAGPSSAFPTRANSNGDNQVYNLREIFREWDGAILDFLDVVSVHNHRIHTKIENYQNSADANGDQVPRGTNSIYNAWRAIDDANEARRAAGKAEKRLPMMNDEGGLMFSSPNGTWGGGPVLYTEGGQTATTHNVALRRYRSGASFMVMCWYGMITWTWFVDAYSGAPQLHYWKGSLSTTWPTSAGGDGLGAAPIDPVEWEERVRIWDHRRYDIDTFEPVFPTKSWQEYHLPFTWGVFIDHGQAPNSTPLVSPPYNPWNNVTFADGVVTMRPGNGAQRNMIYRPIWLRQPGRTHRFQVKVNFDAGSTSSARAKIRVRGHNKLDGLANLEIEAVGGDTSPGGGTGPNNWKTIGVNFQHTGHNVPSLEQVNYALFAIDHNAVGTVRFRDPEVIVR